MLFSLIYLFWNLIKASNEKYAYCMNLLRERIPIDKNQKETHNIMKNYIRYFNNNPPNYKEKEQICFKNKELFETVANDLLQYVQLQNQITTKQMVRCISRNLPLFAYTVVSMANNNKYSRAIEEIRREFLAEKTNPFPQQNTFGKKYVLPQVRRTDLEKEYFFPDDFEEHLEEQNEDDAFMAYIEQDPMYNFMY